jgi:uncharacterized membrane protein YqiK
MTAFKSHFKDSIIARGGMPLAPTQTLGKIVPEANNFQNVRGFLQNGGKRGSQRGILREGTYAINLAQYFNGPER